MEEIEVRITGKVQQVMFRDFVQRKARGLWIVGTVQNLEDRSVKVIAQGTEEHLNTLIAHIHKGPFLARVSRVDVEWREPSGDYNDFTIIY